MGTKSTLTRLQRLEELKGLLRARDHATAAGLASELGVSLRTLNRDLDVLRDSGVPIESGRGRGGGLRLHRNWSLGRLHLSPEEAIDLLLCIVVAEQLNSPMLLSRLGSIKRKISAAFSDAHHGKIRALRKRILIGAPASAEVLATHSASRRASLAGVAEAFFNQQCIEIDYCDNAGATTTRRVEPQFLYFSSPVWYLLTWDYLRGAIRCFRIDRINAARPVESRFRLASPGPFLAQVEEGIRSL